ncbi:MAG: acyl carrier protein [Candidatus Harrisonbacteria bacterium]|nr:acyl carrier protein [Candidatus Harrisonbacteria bacterium]
MKTLEEIIAGVLTIDVKSVNDQTSPENTPGWDSFNSILLVSEVEKNFNVKFELDEVVGLKNVGDFRALLKKRGAF